MSGSLTSPCVACFGPSPKTFLRASTSGAYGSIITRSSYHRAPVSHPPSPLHRYPYLAPRLGAPRSTRACHTFPVLVIGTSHRGVASPQSSRASYTHSVTSLALSLYVAKFTPPDAVAVGPERRRLAARNLHHPSRPAPSPRPARASRGSRRARAAHRVARVARARRSARRRAAKDDFVPVATRFKSLRSTPAAVRRARRAGAHVPRASSRVDASVDPRGASRRGATRGDAECGVRARRDARWRTATRDGGDGDGARGRGRAQGQGARDGARRARRPTRVGARSR